MLTPGFCSGRMPSTVPSHDGLVVTGRQKDVRSADTLLCNRAGWQTKPPKPRASGGRRVSGVMRAVFQYRFPTGSDLSRRRSECSSKGEGVLAFILLLWRLLLTRAVSHQAGLDSTRSEVRQAKTCLTAALHPPTHTHMCTGLHSKSKVYVR